MTDERFADREDAGRSLSDALGSYRDAGETVVYGLARGGVPVAAALARSLNLPLDVLAVRKVGAPGNPELAIGAVTNVGGLVINREVVNSLGVSQDDLQEAAHRERDELDRQTSAFGGESERVSPEGRTVILVDDGLATGASMEAAVDAVRTSGARRVVVAVPVASSSALERVERVADEVRCTLTPPTFMAVGQWYEDFSQTSNEEVSHILGAFSSGSADSTR